MAHGKIDRLYLYWLDAHPFESSKSTLERQGYRLRRALLTPCQVMRAEGRTVVYATPEVWGLMCVRQGSWYRESSRSGQTMMMSAEPLPGELDEYLDAVLEPTDFEPERLPSEEELESLTDSEPYRSSMPVDWEKAGLKDAIAFKTLFSLTRFWGWGDNLKKHWTGHRANHANFLAKAFTTELDGEQVAYSVTGNKGVCSSCVEYFNVVDTDSRKLVRACPGAVTFGGAPRDIFLDVRPQRKL